VATGQTITVYWNAVSGAQTYAVQQQKPDGSTSIHNGLTITNDKWSGLTNSTTYIYSVYACSISGGCSAAAVIASTVGSSSPTTGTINVYYEFESTSTNCGSATITVGSSLVQNVTGFYYGAPENPGDSGNDWCWYNTSFYGVTPGSYRVYAQGGAYWQDVIVTAGGQATARLN
jgi:hypothetical protein